MAVSAYKGQQLKKKPLLGTALGVDTSRAQERASFRRLHKEAKGVAAGGRAAMEKRLGSRLTRYARGQMSGIGQLREQYGKLQEEAGGLRSTEREKELASSIKGAKKIYGAARTTRGGRKYMPKKYIRQFKKEATPEERTLYRKNVPGYYESKLTRAQEAEAAYERNIAEHLAGLQEQGAILASNVARRERSLAERIASYNRFLGV